MTYQSIFQCSAPYVLMCKEEIWAKICNIQSHFSTITRHRNLARKHCSQIGLYWQGLIHDLFEHNPEEFWTGVRYYRGNRNPNAMEREAIGYSRAWLHHEDGNKHYYEHWIDISNHKEGGLVGSKMPLQYVAEMVCDQIAACEAYRGEVYTSATPLEYYEYTKNYVTIHPRTRAFLEKLLHMLKDQGEEITFACPHELLEKGAY